MSVIVYLKAMHKNLNEQFESDKEKYDTAKLRTGKLLIKLFNKIKTV